MRSAELDAVFAALSDPTRRQIIERLARGRMSIGEASAGIRMSQPAISKHVKILEQSGLVDREVAGREHYLRLSPTAMQAASSWIETQRKYWNATFDRLEVYLARTAREGKKKR
jgi:DNA-binding transcriptional ArsR family regulator